MSDRLCGDGHVVEEGREKCSRCNGPVVEPSNEDKPTAEQNEEAKKA